MGSSYFDTSSYLNKETNKSPFTLGSNFDLFDFNKFKNEEKDNKVEIKVGEETIVPIYSGMNVSEYAQLVRDNYAKNRQ